MNYRIRNWKSLFRRQTMTRNRKKKLAALLTLTLTVVLVISSFLSGEDIPQTPVGTVSKSWHHVIGTTYVYSAFWDNRDQRSFVRVLAVGPYHEQLTQVRCYTKSNENVAMVHSTFQIIDFDNHGENHSVLFFLCYPTDQKQPSHVALGDARGHRSTWLSVISMIPQKNIKNNTAVCVRPFFGNYPEDATQLIEFVAYYLIMGVSHFVFYDYRTGEAIRRILRLLAMNEISLELLPWDIPHAIEQYSWQYGQIASITDCVYRMASTYEYVVVVDIDEFIVPKQNITIQTILQSLTDQLEHQSASYVFKHSLFCLDYPDHSSGQNLPIPLITQTKTVRKYLSPVNTRAKSVVRPLAVVAPGIHRVFLTHGKWRSLVVVDPAVATLHHYRNYMCSFWGRFGYETEQDLTALKFRNALLRSFPVRMWLSSKDE